MTSKSFIEFQLMYLVINELYNEEKNENLIPFLSDANPFMRRGENSVDVVVYNEFKEKYDETENHDSYSYEFICDYLKNIDYYGSAPYEYFKKLSKEEYVDTCDGIIKDDYDVLKTL